MLKKSFFTGLLVSSFIAMTAPAQSANSDVIDTLGGTVTLITAPMKSGSTVLRGTIDIELRSGWKTYWRDPGNGGIAPSLQIEGDSAPTQPVLKFPAPEWIEEGEGGHVGYDHSVSIPFTLDMTKNANKTTLHGRLMVGICKDICIPAFAEVTLPITKMTGTSEASIMVDNAFAALPKQPEKMGLSVKVQPADSGSVKIVLNGGDVDELYASGVNGEQMKRPVEISSDDTSSTYLVSPMRKRDAAKTMDIFITGTTIDSSFETRKTVDFSK